MEMIQEMSRKGAAGGPGVAITDRSMLKPFNGCDNRACTVHTASHHVLGLCAGISIHLPYTLTHFHVVVFATCKRQHANVLKPRRKFNTDITYGS